MQLVEIIKALILGIVEGITEWLPISSTGHMILVDEFFYFFVSPECREMFLVVIQLGAIMAVVVLFFHKLWPWYKDRGGIKFRSETIVMWLKILVACIPAAIVGLKFDQEIDARFYNWQTVAIMLVLWGVIFIIVETFKKRKPHITELEDITFLIAFLIGLFQLFAAIFPGTSRSGATIVGGLLLGVSRTVAAEFTFFLAIPVMFGASALKLVRFGIHYSTQEIIILAVGLVSAFLVSIASIKFLMSYIKQNDFKIFGWYRIALGIAVIVFFTFFK
jgi:undecaprenyl-diphosphatase